MATSEEGAYLTASQDEFNDFLARRHDELREFEDAVKQNGVEGAAQYVTDHLEKWREIELNIAVTGMSGSGKSSFINAVRGLQPMMEGEAPVGYVQTTREIRKYKHPKNPKVLFWDLPGVGTAEFPRGKYTEIVKFESYDVYIIMTAGRFLENDVWLGNEARKMKKNVYFIRTKIDLDIAADRHNAPLTHSQDTVLKRARQECQAGLISAGFKNQSVFLISSWMPTEFDFPALEVQILKDVPDLKRAVVVHMMRSSCEPIIREKAEQLRSRAWKVALVSSLAEFSPIPGTSILVDIGVAVRETLFYRETFGLERLIEQAQGLGIAGKAAIVGLRNLIINVADRQMFGRMVADTVVKLGTRYSFMKRVQTVLRAIPYFGGAMNAPFTFVITLAFLFHTISSMEEAASAAINELHQTAAQKLSSSE